MARPVSADDDGLGPRFWLAIAGSTLGIGIGILIGFLVVGYAFWAWGVFGTMVVLSAIALFVAWLFDRRRARSYEDD